MNLVWERGQWLFCSPPFRCRLVEWDDHTHVLVLLDLVPGPPVTRSVPDNLGTLAQSPQVETGTADGNTDDAEG